MRALYGVARAIASCTSADQQGLSQVLDCYAALVPCERGKELTFTSSAFACTLAAPVGQTCQAAWRMAEKR